MLEAFRGHLALSIALGAALSFSACSLVESQPPPTQARITSPAWVPLASCPLTIPYAPYVAAPPQPPKPPERYGAAWYGTDALWTMVQTSGETWTRLPDNGGTLTQKSFWWSRGFVGGAAPDLKVTGTRLDAPGSFSAEGPATEASADFGRAMLIGLDIPSTGCWELRAQYQGAELSVVVLVQ